MRLRRGGIVIGDAPSRATRSSLKPLLSPSRAEQGVVAPKDDAHAPAAEVTANLVASGHDAADHESGLARMG